MDADLQHPPELVPELMRRAVEGDLDLVVASRRCEGGADGFGLLRGLLSEISTFAARRLFPQRLRTISDPMSGFFLLRRDAVTLERLRPRGFKILLELLLRNPDLRVDEVPFRFGRRYAGESKASLGQGLSYLRQLALLRLAGGVSGFVRGGTDVRPAALRRADVAAEVEHDHVEVDMPAAQEATSTLEIGQTRERSCRTQPWS
jgi:hypothetical protein